MQKLNKLDVQTLNACDTDLALWKNKIFKIEIDTEQQEIRVISKRRSMNGKGFIVPLFEELTSIKKELLEKYIYSKYTTSIYLYC